MILYISPSRLSYIFIPKKMQAELKDFSRKLIDFEKLRIKLATIDWEPVTNEDSIISGPVLLHATFELIEKGTWIKLDSLKRGVLIVNGHVIR